MTIEEAETESVFCFSSFAGVSLRAERRQVSPLRSNAMTWEKEMAVDAKLTTDQRRELIQLQRAAEIEQFQVREIKPRGYDRSGSGFSM